ncbi:MAG: AAA family ATPase, partial [Ktedonobacterales bacterium]
MWGKRQATRTATATGGVAAGAQARPLGASDLLRRADWEHFTDAQRAALMSAFQPFPAPTVALNTSTPADIAPAALQDWVSNLVGATFQSEPAQLISAWLDDSPPDAHLYVGGDSGLGKRSLVAALARQRMRGRPKPPDYCYGPIPDAMDAAYLLALPNGTGADFAKALDATLRAITSGWDDGSGDGDSDQSGGNAGASGGPGGAGVAPTAEQQSAEQQSAARQQLIAQTFAPLEQASPPDATAYVRELRAAFTALATAQADLPVAYENIPTVVVRASVSGGTSDKGTQAGAPVILGSLIRDKLDDLLTHANGGVLILSAADLMLVDGAWPTLAVALTARTLSYKADWPPLPLSVRVILVGDMGAYAALDNAPGDFERIFRYETWCSSAVNWTPAAEATYAALADGVARRHALPPFDFAGVARLIEEGSRRGDGLNRTYLSASLLMLHDIALEAGRMARARNATATSGADVDAALQRRRALQGVNARRVREAIFSGQEITPTTGAAIGQINGLGIYEFHPVEGSFAVPTRISATVNPSMDEHLLDIEHEASQADADHVRGELTIEGYLAYRYGQNQPLNLGARIRFEQEHGTTGGDSASGAILYALLSALAQVPIHYSYAVTGAVGQYGELQPIGGVNTKIEGFWELCRQRRAQGERSDVGYGVVIPAVNM